MDKVCSKATAVLDVNLVAFIVKICRNYSWNNVDRLFVNRFLSYRFLSYRLLNYRLFNNRFLNNRLLNYRFLDSWFFNNLFNYRFFNNLFSYRLFNNLFNDRFFDNLFRNCFFNNLFNDCRSNVWLVNENRLNVTVNREELNCKYSIVVATADNCFTLWLNAPTNEGWAHIPSLRNLEVEVV